MANLKAALEAATRAKERGKREAAEATEALRRSNTAEQEELASRLEREFGEKLQACREEAEANSDAAAMRAAAEVIKKKRSVFFREGAIVRQYFVLLGVRVMGLNDFSLTPPPLYPLSRGVSFSIIIISDNLFLAGRGGWAAAGVGERPAERF